VQGRISCTSADLCSLIRPKILMEYHSTSDTKSALITRSHSVFHFPSRDRHGFPCRRLFTLATQVSLPPLVGNPVPAWPAVGGGDCRVFRPPINFTFRRTSGGRVANTTRALRTVCVREIPSSPPIRAILAPRDYLSTPTRAWTCPQGHDMVLLSSPCNFGFRG
jgi:hypothetical protein